MRCPHCLVEFHHSPTRVPLAMDVDGGWCADHCTCPACKRLVIFLAKGVAHRDGRGVFAGINGTVTLFLVRPRGALRPPCPKEVPEHLAKDYNEACAVIADSTKASAALSRRCLQVVLREAAKVKPGDLSKEIQQVLDSNTLPSYLAESIDAVRNICNFAAHPLKSQHSGEVLDVEPGEAEWNLEVLESLFDFYFVQPALLQAKRAALDAKLKEAGKPPMK